MVRGADGFWKKSAYATKTYVELPVTAARVRRVERALGYRLPEAYVDLLCKQNGGMPKRALLRRVGARRDEIDEIHVSGFFGIGSTKRCSLGGEHGSRFWIQEWEYPPIGVYFADTPSGGHDMLCLDYRECGPEGEPQVVHVDQEGDFRITKLAKSFAAFVEALEDPEPYEDAERQEARRADLRRVERGALSPLLRELVDGARAPFDIERALRSIAREIVAEKGYFALHADARSRLLYDAQLWLYASQRGAPSRTRYLAEYPNILALGGAFSTGGYAPAFVEEWLDVRISAGTITRSNGRLRFTRDARAALVKTLARLAR